MDCFKIKTPFCGTGNLRSVAITSGFVYLILALGGTSTGFGYNPSENGYGPHGENYLLILLGISSVLWIFSNILLIYGAVKKRHRLILPWIYWQLVFVIIALMVLIWSSIVMAEMGKPKNLRDQNLRVAMIAALCCVVPFLFTVIYSSIVVYSFYCELKGVKSKEDMPVTSASPRYVTSPGNSSTYRAPNFPTKTQAGNVQEGVRMQNDCYNLGRMPPSSITSPRAPAIPPKTQEDENIYDELQIHTAPKNLGSGAAKADEDEIYAVYDYTLPDKNPNQFK